jgi:hypothetical protein
VNVLSISDRMIILIFDVIDVITFPFRARERFHLYRLLRILGLYVIKTLNIIENKAHPF